MATTHPAELNNGVWTSWLPVTTAWTSQEVCNTAAWARNGIQTSPGFVPYIYDPAYAESVSNGLTCLPPQATTWWYSGTTISNTITSYSMGPVVCPAAYETVSTVEVSGSSTSIICCPTGFQFARHITKNGGIDGVCTSPMTSGQAFTYASPTADSYISVATTLPTHMALIAVPFEGYNFATSTTTSFSSPLRTSTTITTRPSDQLSSQGTSTTGSVGLSLSKSTSTAKSGMSEGTKIGIGLGCGLVILVLIATVSTTLLLKRRRREKDMSNTLAVSELPSNGRIIYGGTMPEYTEVHEIEGQSSMSAELPG